MTNTKLYDYIEVAGSGGIRIICAWDDCYQMGTTLHRLPLHEHQGSCMNEDGSEKPHGIMLFCSEKHKQYHLNSKNSYGNVAAGYRN